MFSQQDKNKMISACLNAGFQCWKHLAHMTTTIINLDENSCVQAMSTYFAVDLLKNTLFY